MKVYVVSHKFKGGKRTTDGVFRSYGAAQCFAKEEFGQTVYIFENDEFCDYGQPHISKNDEGDKVIIEEFYLLPEEK